MKETIEWYRNDSDGTPHNGAEVLMKMNGGPGELIGVLAGNYYTNHGFLLPCGESVSPTMWCYFPKGEQ